MNTPIAISMVPPDAPMGATLITIDASIFALLAAVLVATGVSIVVSSLQHWRTSQRTWQPVYRPRLTPHSA